MILPKGPSLSLQIFQLEPDTKCSFVTHVSPMRTTDRQCSHDALAVCMKCEAPLCVLHCEQCETCHQELCEGCAALHSEDCRPPFVNKKPVAEQSFMELLAGLKTNVEQLSASIGKPVTLKPLPQIGLPSASDLDSVSQEEKVREATGGKQ